MKKFIFSIVFVISASIGFNASAASGGLTGKITTMQFYEGHVGVLIKQEGMTDLRGCGRSDFFILDESHPFFKEIYALILASYLASQPIYLFMDGCVQGLSRIKHISSAK